MRRGRRPEVAGLDQPGRIGQPEGAAEEARHRVDRLLDGLDPGHPDRHAGVAEPAYVELAVLLLVGHDEVGGERPDRGQVGVLGAPHAGHVEVGGVGAPLGRPDERSGADAASASVRDGTSETTRSRGRSGGRRRRGRHAWAEASHMTRRGSDDRVMGAGGRDVVELLP